jgi:hypothetical protein
VTFLLSSAKQQVLTVPFASGAPAMIEPTPPTQVIKRDGQVVPFDADRISRALFAAGESIGRPDALLARDLADGVVHFLCQESSGTPTTEQIADIVVKVVRELGQPTLAAAFEHHGQQRVRRPVGAPDVTEQASAPSLGSLLADCARRFTLQTVYTRDLAAAQEVGLLTMTGLETPGELGSCVLGPPVPRSPDVLADLEQARRFAARQVAFDGLEHLGGVQGQTPADLAGAIALGLRLTGLEGVVNLNVATPPSWAGSLVQGPLFSVEPLDRAALGERSAELCRELLRQAPAVRIDWHLSEDSFDEGGRACLLRQVQSALDGANIAFVFDRPRKPIALAEGLDRGHPATLLTVGLNLPALARLPGMLADAERFRQRLGSLVRLALSAAVQKRQYLRRHAPALTSNFLLDRSCFVVTPVGLDEVVYLFSEWGLSNGGESLELGRQILQRLREVLQQASRLAQMDACLDGPAAFAWDGSPVSRETVAGLTPWDPTASARSQLRAGDALHNLAGHGTLGLFVPNDGSASAEQVVEWLRSAWRQTDVVRLRLL